jgi:NADPH2:quinone reductase
MVGGSYFERNLRALRPMGRLVQIAFQAGAKVELSLPDLMQKRLIITGSTLRSRSPEEKARLAVQVEHHVWPMVEVGKIDCIIDRTFPLKQAAQAHARLEAGEHVGKIILTT